MHSKEEKVQTNSQNEDFTFLLPQMTGRTTLWFSSLRSQLLLERISFLENNNAIPLFVSQESQNPYIDEDFASAVSFQVDRLSEHIYSFLAVSKKFGDFAAIRIMISNLEMDDVFDDSTLSLGQYLEKLAQLGQDRLLEVFMEVAGDNNRLWRFLLQIFEKGPLYLTKDLMVIFFRVVVSCARFREVELSLEQIFQMANNPYFLANIFCDDTLRIFNNRYIWLWANGWFLEQLPHILFFMRFYVLTLILVMQGYFNNPFYSQIEALGKELQLSGCGARERERSAGGKMIKKQSF